MATIKPKVAFFDFAGCEGCQLTVIDALQTHLDLLGAVEIVQFREAMTEMGEDYDVAFVEGACTRKCDEDRLLGIREHAKVVVALGACACFGGVNALKNTMPLEDVRRYVYGDKADVYETYAARPISDVIAIDAFIPGCPIDREEFIRAVKALLQGRQPPIPDYPVCVECKLRENGCLYEQGKPCLGPIVRAGCGALCPTFGHGCEGCRGLIPNPNIRAMLDVMYDYKISDLEITSRMNIFMTNQVTESEVGGDGSD